MIIDGVTHNEKLSVCFDTCHTHDAGYNIIEDFDGVLNEFDKVVGVDRIKVLHINDSKNERGTRKDRHENIGFGHIGFKALNDIVHHPQLSSVPKILETPYVGKTKKTKRPHINSKLICSRINNLKKIYWERSDSNNHK